MWQQPTIPVNHGGGKVAVGEGLVVEEGGFERLTDVLADADEMGAVVPDTDELSDLLSDVDKLVVALSDADELAALLPDADELVVALMDVDELGALLPDADKLAVPDSVSLTDTVDWLVTVKLDV